MIIKKTKHDFRHFLCLPVILFFITNLSSGQETITGLLYSDKKPVSITYTNGEITSVKRIRKLPEGNRGYYIAPGLIDKQVNGFAGVSFTFGGGELTAEGVRKAAYALWRTGVTTFIPTLTTNSIDVLKKNLIVLAYIMDDSSLLGSIPGFHLEGPYISPVDGYRGAHPLKYVHKPDWKEFMSLYDAAGKKIIQVTVAPEVEGAMDFISKCKALGIVVALGHHNADSKTVTAAVKEGARIATHIGNGCANTINRHYNPIWPQLSDDNLMISIIGDGFHLLPEEIRVFYKVKGPYRTIITSDVTSYASMPPGIYITNEGDTIELTSQGMLRYPAQNVLFGSASPMKRGVENVLKVTGCSLQDVFQMASINPARLYNLDDRGSIRIGKRADLILFKIVDDEIIIMQTIVKGKEVYNQIENRQ
jgi:N-acetylglucosamine-6-phosphate deacetylase